MLPEEIHSEHILDAIPVIASSIRISRGNHVDKLATLLTFHRFLAGTNDGVFGFSADAFRFQLELERDGDDWLLISARWGELGEELH